MEDAVLSIYKLPASFSYAGFHRLQPNSSLRGRGLHNNSKTPQLIENKKSILEKVFNFVKGPYRYIYTTHKHRAQQNKNAIFLTT